MYQPYEKLIQEKPDIVIWGTGNCMKKNIELIDPTIKVKFFADSYGDNWNTYPAKNTKSMFEDVICKSKEQIGINDVVLIAIESKKDIKTVEKELDVKGINYCHIVEAVHSYLPAYDRIQVDKFYKSKQFINEYDNKKIIKFINCHVPYSACNFRCKYCYIGQLNKFESKKNYFHSPEFIRAALSKERLGGGALINFCASGETMMCKELVPIIIELVKEGHYVSIVTNGTISPEIDKFLDADIDFEHVFFKFSFHYLELKRQNLFKTYLDNINKIRNAGCSFTVELAPSDDLVPHIDEIKEFSLKNWGALPQLTVTRDDRTQGIDVLTDYSIDEYKNIWSTFNSDLFEYKISRLGIKVTEDCMAGKWSFNMNLETGDIYKCVGNPYLDNIYKDLSSEIYLEPVRGECKLPYCYNCHAYITLGLVKELEAPTYFEVRSRINKDGKHWVHGKTAKIFKQKLYDNNYR